jgi:bifunctional UDP-N-acetylglucosamine pyrophosphorylase/glucosamine-1-phosphate N-acetyltransferase
MNSTAVIIAAGLGTRMKSRLPKAAHKIAGREMLRHLILAAEQVFERIVVVIGPEMDQLATLSRPHHVVIQHQRLGTAHAAQQAAPFFSDGPTAIFYADNPLVSAQTMTTLLARLHAGDAQLVLMGTTPPDAGKYGRLIVEDGYVRKIVEFNDATADELQIGFCNAGGLIATGRDIAAWLSLVGNNNAKGEYYLTDIVEIANRLGANVAALDIAFEECIGVNSRAELAQAEALFQRRARDAAMANGVTMQAPETVFLAADTELGENVTIAPHVVFGPHVRVEADAEIKSFSHLEGCVVRAGAIIGPFARLRPGADIGENAHIGNFVEVKAATLEAGVKANHLAYIGDGHVGAQTNIGAGTIFCNYDGRTKHQTKIGARAFIGSNSALVAPVTIGDEALVAAGSVVTENVPGGSVAIARGRQVNKEKKPPQP